MMHQPNLTPNPDKINYAVLDDYHCHYGNIKIVVPEFFIYDGASIPAIAWQLTYTPFHPCVMAPSLVHDWMYCNHQVTRDMADQIFYDLLILNGANKSKAKIIYHAVSKFGSSRWEMSEIDKLKLFLVYSATRKKPNFNDYCFPIDSI